MNCAASEPPPITYMAVIIPTSQRAAPTARFEETSPTPGRGDPLYPLLSLYRKNLFHQKVFFKRVLPIPHVLLFVYDLVKSKESTSFEKAADILC